MNLFTLFLLALALSTDAFAVSVSLGISIKNPKKYYPLITALSFGIFQGVMPVLGFLASYSFKGFIDNYSYIIAFLLLFFIGGKMIYEVYNDNGKENLENTNFSFKTLVFLSIATSIDAFAAGISLAILDVNIYLSALFITLVTFLTCFAGFLFGKKIGRILKNKAQVFGGIVLIAIGLKSLFEHFGWFSLFY